ncbi:uncharacterized protein TEOVI_000474800 [Trypanosoma equiperdum]|uniref:Uncharacterized protein n=1 Tax=Trypanosoma equiperdum TaxID=5694 RepID=A0A1G4I1L8_TRYEQ|nr:hypothetical protein TEOVI_000474800 [Trypanosoma equiperdum]
MKEEPENAEWEKFTWTNEAMNIIDPVGALEEKAARDFPISAERPQFFSYDVVNGSCAGLESGCKHFNLASRCIKPLQMWRDSVAASLLVLFFTV